MENSPEARSADLVARVVRMREGAHEHNTLVVVGVDYEVWIRAFDHWAVAPIRLTSYTLTGPLPGNAVTRQGSTDGKGDLRERYLPAGEYTLKFGQAEATVAARCLEPVGEKDGGRETQTASWPDAVRIKNDQLPPDQTGAADDEPGEAVPKSWIGSRNGDPWLIEEEPFLDDEGEGRNDMMEDVLDDSADEYDEDDLAEYLENEEDDEDNETV